MSDEQTVWSDAEIVQRAQQCAQDSIGHANIGLERWIEGALYEVRDDLTARLRAAEAERDVARARIAELEAALDAVCEPTSQPHICIPWHPVDAILWNGLSLHADDHAVTIGHGDTALATFAWPEEGEYAVCKRTQPPEN